MMPFKENLIAQNTYSPAVMNSGMGMGMDMGMGMEPESDPMMDEMLSGLSNMIEPIPEPWETIEIKDKEVKKDIVTRVVEKFRYAETDMSDMVSTWMDIQDAYRSEREFTVDRGVKKPESRIKTGLMRKLTNRMVSMLCSRIVQPYNNFISAKVRKSKTRSYKIENLLFDMYKKNKLPMEVVKAVTRTALYGVAFTKVMPDTSSARPNSIVTTVNNFDIKIDPYATTLKKEDCSFICERLWVDYDTVVKRMQDGVWDKEETSAMIEAKAVRDAGIYISGSLLGDNTVRFAGAGDRSGESINNGLIRAKSIDSGNIDRSDMRDVSDSSVTKFDRFMIYEYYDRDYIYVVGEEGYFLRAMKNPVGYPYQDWRLLPSTGEEFWVKGHGEYLLNLQQEMDVKRNQRNENLNKMLNPTMVMLKNFINDPSALVIDSGRKIPVNDLEGYKIIEIPDCTATILQELNYLQSEGEDETSVTQVAQGKAAKGERMTSGESANLYTQANLPFDFGSSLLAINGLIPMLEMMLLMCGLTWQGEFAEASSAPNGVDSVEQIMPIEMMDDYDIEVSINPNKEELDKEDALQFYQLFSQNPYIDQIVLLQWVLPRLSPDYPRNLISMVNMMGMQMGVPTGQMQPGNVQLSNTGGGNESQQPGSGGPAAQK